MVRFEGQTQGKQKKIQSQQTRKPREGMEEQGTD